MSQLWCCLSYRELAHRAIFAAVCVVIDAGTIYLLFHAVVGATLGIRSPAKGLAVFLALVSVTASLPWHLGLGNLPATDVYLVCFLAAASARALTQNSNSGGRGNVGELPGSLRVCVFVVCLLFGGSMLLAMFRGYLYGQPIPVGAFQSVLARLLTFRPDGFAGQVHVTYVALIGPAVLVLSVRSLREQRDRVLIRNAFFCGLTLAVVSPAVQVLAFQPWARPDLGLAVGTGLSGFFYDPHSYAAYLVLGIGVALGAALGWKRRGDRVQATAAFLVASMAFIVLRYTDSRAGLLVGVATLLFLFAQIGAQQIVGRTWSFSRWGIAASLAVLLSIAAASVLIVVSPPGREATGDDSANPATSLMRDPFEAEQAVWDQESVYIRFALWRKALTLIQERPIWGAGPDSFRHVEVPLSRSDGTPIRTVWWAENAHNYYLQLGAEYGVPALVSFALLVVLTFVTIVRASWRCTEPLQQGILAGIAAGQAGFFAFSLVSHPWLLAEIQATYWSLAGLGIASAVHVPAGMAESCDPT